VSYFHVISDKKIAFTAYGINVIGSSLRFPQVYQNYGNSYNSSTGNFTCQVPGVYHFVTTLTKQWSTDPDFIQCFLLHNGNQVAGSKEDNHNHEEDKGVYSFTISATLHLQSNDVVNIGQCTAPDSLYSNNRCSFTGFLVAPDN
jgi:hypothetical protein